MKSDHTAVKVKRPKSQDLDDYQLFIDGLREGLFISRGDEFLTYNKRLSESLHMGRENPTLFSILDYLQRTENTTARSCILRIVKGFNFGPIKVEIPLGNGQNQAFEIRTQTIRFLGSEALGKVNKIRYLQTTVTYV